MDPLLPLSAIPDADFESDDLEIHVDAQVAEIEDLVRMVGIGIEDIETGDPTEATIMSCTSGFVIRLHRNAPHRVWVLQNALTFLKCGHPLGQRSDAYQPNAQIDYSVIPRT